jgi:CheY-like chemotaxis protein
VLIVDDEATTRTLVRLLLERDGYHVLEAFNGQHALDLAATHDVDLVVMDLLMPELDGYGAILALRNQERHSATPIVVVTTEERPVVEKQVLDLGADDYILKPFEWRRAVRPGPGVARSPPRAARATHGRCRCSRPMTLRDLRDLRVEKLSERR